ncbi:synembryn isoform X2 [Planococcus citri]|uniref:synembryn isoform X2 n=1 Tax=Planococcus citri TaxID=170843 RepID=UPI0031F726AA
MDNISLIRMEDGTLEDIKSVLVMFTEQNKESFTFDNLEKDNVLQRLWTIVFKHLKDKNSESIYELCLKTLRILSRDKVNLEKCINDQRIEDLLEHAALKGTNAEKVDKFKEHAIIVEALKCLCNMTFNSAKVQTICSTNGTLEGIIRRLRLHPDANIPHLIKYFDMKLLFLITAYKAEVRTQLKEQLHALTYLMEALDFILKEGGGYSHDNHLQYFPALDENAVELSCEILKVLFNLTVRVLPLGTEDDFEPSDRLITILRELLLSSTPPHVQDKLCSNIINLLTNMPANSYEMLMPQEEDEYNSEAIDVMINFLENRLSSSEGASYENLSPVLQVLTEGSRTHKFLRKHIRMRVLPPLRDVMKKPEEGNKIRNRLCRLLTGTNTHLRDAVAEFLFVLCKENVGRMIKYTGFGNAAGMFASRGLLNEAAMNPDYSSDSENSETEEYKEYKDQINPVIGCFDPAKPSPMQSMTEEQKEYEAMKLVNAIDKLHKGGVIQACKIGEDGKPQPVEHILQLQEELQKQQLK